MKWILLLLVFVLAGVYLGPFILELPGFVIIGYDVHTAEMRLTTFLVLLLMSVLIIIFTIWVIKVLLRSGLIAKRWNSGRGQKKARTRGINGLIALAEGKWDQAEKLMTQAAQKSDTKLLNYLLAAQAAQEQGAVERRDEYLRQAYKEASDAELAIGLTQARLQMQHLQYEQALATLNHIQTLAPKHPHVLNQLKKLYIKLGDWKALAELLPKLKKFKIINDNEWIELSLSILQSQLSQQDTVESLNQYWNSLPKALKKHLAALKAYINALIDLNDFSHAEKLLQQQLKKHVDDDLLVTYCSLSHCNPGVALKFVESKVSGHTPSVDVYLALSKIALENQLWGKAQSYLEQAQSLKPTVEGYWLLSKTYHGMQDQAKEQQAYQAGLALAQAE